MDEMNPRMTEFLAQDRIAALRSEATTEQRLKRSADPAPRIDSRPSPETASQVALVGRWLRRAITV